MEEERYKMSEAKTYLKKLNRKRIQISTLEKQIANLDELVHSPLKAVTYDRDVVQTSHTGSEGTDKIVELADMEEKLIRLKTTLELDIDRVRDEIWSLPTDKFMELLSILYLEGYDLDGAAAEMGKSYDHVRHMHGAALAEFQKVVLDPRKETKG